MNQKCAEVFVFYKSDSIWICFQEGTQSLALIRDVCCGNSLERGNAVVDLLLYSDPFAGCNPDR